MAVHSQAKYGKGYNLTIKGEAGVNAMKVPIAKDDSLEDYVDKVIGRLDDDVEQGFLSVCDPVQIAAV